MGICSLELRRYVITPTLNRLDVCSVAAENLLLGTASAQSGLGYHLGDHSHIGIYGIQATTHRELWDTYLAFDEDLASKVRGLASQREFLKNPDIELATNLSYATAIAWMLYKRADITLPHENDITGLARCWLTVFATSPDQSVDQFIQSYRQLNELPDKAA